MPISFNLGGGGFNFGGGSVPRYSFAQGDTSNIWNQPTATSGGGKSLIPWEALIGAGSNITVQALQNKQASDIIKAQQQQAQQALQLQQEQAKLAQQQAEQQLAVARELSLLQTPSDTPTAQEEQGSGLLGGIDTTTLLLIGGGVLVLIMFMGKGKE